MGEIHNTQFFKAVQENKMDVSQVLEQVYVALTEKGYNPVNQIVGYIMSGDPTYITSHKGARSLIMKMERDDVLDRLFARADEALYEAKRAGRNRVMFNNGALS